MESVIHISSSPSICLPISTKSHFNNSNNNWSFSFNKHAQSTVKTLATSDNGALSPQEVAASRAVGDAHRRRSGLESLFCYDKPIPEEIIETPVGIALAQKNIGDKPRCSDCEAKGAVLCATCAGSGLYVDSIMESQGIIVKVRCLGCGGTGNIMCSNCGGRGHVGAA